MRGCSVHILVQGSKEVHPAGLCVKAGAVKRMPYATPLQQSTAEAELAALKDAEGLPHLVQCLAAFDNTCAASGKRYLLIITE